MKKLVPILVTLVLLGAGLAFALGGSSKPVGVAAEGQESTITTATATAAAPASDEPTPAAQGGSTDTTAASTTSAAAPTTTPKGKGGSTTSTTRPSAPTTTGPYVDDEPITVPGELGTSATTQAPTTTTIKPGATSTTSTVPPTTTTTRPPVGAVTAEPSAQVVWPLANRRACQPVQVTLLNHSNTRVVSVDITFYLYDYPMGGLSYWEGPYRKAVSIPADNGTRAPYPVTVNVCPIRDDGHWATHPNHPNYPGGVQLTWRWEGQ